MSKAGQRDRIPQEQIEQRIQELKVGWTDMRNQADVMRDRLEQLEMSMSANIGAINELSKLLPEPEPPAEAAVED